jgi:hypothetical protein
VRDSPSINQLLTSEQSLGGAGASVPVHLARLRMRYEVREADAPVKKPGPCGGFGAPGLGQIWKHVNHAGAAAHKQGKPGPIETAAPGHAAAARGRLRDGSAGARGLRVRRIFSSCNLVISRSFMWGRRPTTCDSIHCRTLHIILVTLLSSTDWPVDRRSLGELRKA